MSSLAVVGASGAPGLKLTAIVFVCLAGIFSVRLTTNAGLSTVIVNSVSLPNTFLKVTPPAPPRRVNGPCGLGAIHRPITGHTYSPPTGEVTTSVLRKDSPMRVGSNVTSTSCSFPSGPAGCPATAACTANSSLACENAHAYSALSARKCVNLNTCASLEPRGTLNTRPRSGPAGVADSRRVYRYTPSSAQRRVRGTSSPASTSTGRKKTSAEADPLAGTSSVVGHVTCVCAHSQVRSTAVSRGLDTVTDVDARCRTGDRSSSTWSTPAAVAVTSTS
mmetsp:Transcript_12125/g.19567  ORF Transcript_12125/g.19567 Transcript_12125/m.19567 type:complete len:277 (-) Transcript_12125:3284-4114(-)